MAIKSNSMDFRSKPTRMGQIWSGFFWTRVEFGFLKKYPNRVWGRLGFYPLKIQPDPTRIYIHISILILKIYIVFKRNPTSPHFFLPAILSSQISPTVHSSTTFTHHDHEFTVLTLSLPRPLATGTTPFPTTTLVGSLWFGA